MAAPPTKKRKLNDDTTEAVQSNNEYNICAEVHETCQMIMKHQNKSDAELDCKENEVWIDEQAIDAEIAKNGDKYLKQCIDELEWEKDAYHYFNANDMELTLRFILVLDALNFCFWPLPNYEYEHLGAGLKRTLQRDANAFNPQNLMTLKKETLSEWLLSAFDDKQAKIPLIEERTRLLNEVGRVIHYEYDGKVCNFVKSARGSATKLVELISKKFRGFSDHCICPWMGKQVFFYKRAQIFVAEIYAAYKGQSIGKFDDIAQLSCFADYRVPQLLRALNIIKYSDRLSALIDAEKLIQAGSREEILIRASMICAVEKLKEKLNEHRRKQANADGATFKELISIEIDWCLWNRGEQLNADKKLKPHHRTLTVYY